MQGRGQLPRGGEEDEALQEPSRVHIALADSALASGSVFSWDIPALFAPAQAELNGAELKGRRSRSVDVPGTLRRCGGCAWIPLCCQDEGILSGIPRGERRGHNQGLAPPGCRGVSACTPLCAQNGFLLSLKRTRIISQLLSTLSINNDNVVKPH